MRLLAFGISLFFLQSIYAGSAETTRILYFSNDRVSVWQTIIYPHSPLKMHRHEHDRVLVALDSGTLKIQSNTGKESYLELKKDEPYYLSKNSPGEMHSDENIGKDPMRVIVIELKDSKRP